MLRHATTICAPWAALTDVHQSRRETGGRMERFLIGATIALITLLLVLAYVYASS